MSGVMEHPAAEPHPVEPAPASRKVALSIMAGFTVVAVAVTVLAGDLLDPAATTADGDYAGETF